ncbi:hypothetical protein T459_11932 [Capsicum annuum]|uniref:Uncharacterized protein n=1 Tax=Capsicum annuum TaxID=4072 RepID=A0A2G2ZNB9_CAPAN|nr:hypothetical protein T459_11932 [Capsicum annuum]
MMVPTIFFFLQFSSLLYLFTASFASTEEATALLKWKATFHNQNNSLLAPWTLITDAFRDWYGIICFNSWINRLNIANASVTGDLTELKILYLYSNQLSGSIPSELGNLKNLTYLALSDNQFGGSILIVVGDLTKLKRLYLHSNQFSGPISGELGNLKNLTGMDLARNQFSGSIPITLGDLIKLKRLYLSSNQLFDPIPSELGNSKNLTILELVANQLTLGRNNISGSMGKYAKKVEIPKCYKWRSFTKVTILIPVRRNSSYDEFVTSVMQSGDRDCTLSKVMISYLMHSREKAYFEDKCWRPIVDDIGVPHWWVKGSLISLNGLGQSFPRELAFEVELVLRVKPTLFIAFDVGPPVLYCPRSKCPSLGVRMDVGVPYRWVKGSLISLYGLEQSFPHELAFKVELGPRSISLSDDDLIDNDLNDYKNDGNHPINMEDDSMHMEDFSSNSQDDAEDCGTESQPGHSFTDGTNFYYGQTFANKKELKMLLDTIVTRQSFDYYMEKSCTKLIKAKYLSRGCGWLFRAKKYDTLQKNLSW